MSELLIKCNECEELCKLWTFKETGCPKCGFMGYDDNTNEPMYLFKSNTDRISYTKQNKETNENVWVIKASSNTPECPRCKKVMKMNLFDRRYPCHCGLQYYMPLSGLCGQIREGWYDEHDKKL